MAKALIICEIVAVACRLSGSYNTSPISPPRFRNLLLSTHNLDAPASAAIIARENHPTLYPSVPVDVTADPWVLGPVKRPHPDTTCCPCYPLLQAAVSAVRLARPGIKRWQILFPALIYWKVNAPPTQTRRRESRPDLQRQSAFARSLSVLAIAAPSAPSSTLRTTPLSTGHLWLGPYISPVSSSLDRGIPPAEYFASQYRFATAGQPSPQPCAPAVFCQRGEGAAALDLGWPHVSFST